MKVTIADIVGVFLDRIFKPLHEQIKTMSQQVSNLQTAVTALTAAVAATTSNEAALKQKLDAAVADNVAKAATITDLQAQLAAAQANAGDPADAAAIDAVTTTVQAQTQALMDAATANSPSN